MKLFFQIVAVILFIALCVWGYRYWHQRQEETTGETNCVAGCPTPEEKAAFARKNNGGDDPGMISGPVPARTSAPGSNTLDNTTPANTTASNQTVPGANQAAAPQKSLLPPAPADFPASKPAPAPSYTAPTNYTATNSATGASMVPAHDSIVPNPPNGTSFTGTGQFLLYRQGDLTWELNTATGRTCIKFATMEEWRKAIVMHNGCGRAA